MSWPCPRPSHNDLSTHQTLLGKALYEHGDCKTVAAVAASSSSIQNSSLGPNLLALLELNETTVPLFQTVFLFDNREIASSASTTTLQFAKNLTIMFDHPREGSEACAALISTLVKNTRYFRHSLKSLEFIVGNNNQLPEFGQEYEFDQTLFSRCFAPSSSDLIVEGGNQQRDVEDSMIGLTSFKITNGRRVKSRETIVESHICLSGKFPNLTELDLERKANVTDKEVAMITSSSSPPYSSPRRVNLPHLKSLNLSFCLNIAGRGFAPSSSFGGNLTTLNLEGCHKIDDDVVKYNISSSADLASSLTHLNISSCRFISDEGIASIATSFLKLQQLDIAFVDKMTDVGIQSIFRNLHELRVLNATHCASMTLDHGKEFFSAAEDSAANTILSPSSLTELDFSDCPNISSSGFQQILPHLSNLSHLKLSYSWSQSHYMPTNCINDDFLEGISNSDFFKSGGLETLDFTSCTEITDEGLEFLFQKNSTMKKLKTLKLSRMEDVTDETLNLIISHPSKMMATTLINLELSRFDSLSGGVLKKLMLSACSDGVVGSSPPLQSLSLKENQHTDDELVRIISTTFANLTELNLSGCPLVTDEAIEHLAASDSKVSELKILNLNLSRITDKGVMTIARSLNFSKLKELHLVSPRLTSSDGFAAAFGLSQNDDNTPTTKIIHKLFNLEKLFILGSLLSAECLARLSIQMREVNSNFTCLC